jgi:bifunctional UDP-N-acetylglucosamine pyrophosphorylase/glucosamine-1-phosphate N-acetyltransferase
MAGGKGTRMKSKTNKLLHKILGKEIIKFPVDAMEEAGVEKILLITGSHNEEILKSVLNDRVEYVLQKIPLGTADAVKSAIPVLDGFEGELLITVGDNPYLGSGTIKEFYDFHVKNGYDISIITTDFDNPPPYGRIVRDGKGNFIKLVEEIVATKGELKIKEVSSSIFLFNWQKILPYLYEIKNDNPKGEYFLPDAINFLSAAGGKVGLFKVEEQEITKGLNNREELIEAISYFNKKNIDKIVEKGVTIVSPENTFIEFNVEIGNDSIIYPFNYIRSYTKINRGSIIKSFQYK